MIAMDEALSMDKDQVFGSRLVLQVHDELGKRREGGGRGGKREKGGGKREKEEWREEGRGRKHGQGSSFWSQVVSQISTRREGGGKEGGGRGEEVR
jgi:hypothetical protein